MTPEQQPKKTTEERLRELQKALIELARAPARVEVELDGETHSTLVTFSYNQETGGPTTFAEIARQKMFSMGEAGYLQLDLLGPTYLKGKNRDEPTWTYGILIGLIDQVAEAGCAPCRAVAIYDRKLDAYIVARTYHPDYHLGQILGYKSPEERWMQNSDR